MPALTIQLTDQEQARLKELAEVRGVDPPECARALLGELLGDPGILPQHVGVESLALEPSNVSDRQPIWRRAVEAGMALPADERARIPRDGSFNVDHYVYGLAKRD